MAFGSRRLEYMRKDVVLARYIAFVAFPATYSASSVEIWHPPRTGRENGS
jgi:hypothetical protein